MLMPIQTNISAIVGLQHVSIWCKKQPRSESMEINPSGCESVKQEIFRGQLIAEIVT